MKSNEDLKQSRHLPSSAFPSFRLYCVLKKMLMMKKKKKKKGVRIRTERGIKEKKHLSSSIMLGTCTSINPVNPLNSVSIFTDREITLWTAAPGFKTRPVWLRDDTLANTYVYYIYWGPLTPINPKQHRGYWDNSCSHETGREAELCSKTSLFTPLVTHLNPLATHQTQKLPIFCACKINP